MLNNNNIYTVQKINFFTKKSKLINYSRIFSTEIIQGVKQLYKQYSVIKMGKELERRKSHTMVHRRNSPKKHLLGKNEWKSKLTRKIMSGKVKFQHEKVKLSKCKSKEVLNRAKTWKTEKRTKFQKSKSPIITSWMKVSGNLGWLDELEKTKLKFPIVRANLT